MAEEVHRSLVDYGDEDDEEEDSGARSSDDDLLVPRKRVRVQKTEEGTSLDLMHSHLMCSVVCRAPSKPQLPLSRYH